MGEGDSVYVALAERVVVGEPITASFDQEQRQFESLKDLRAAINTILETRSVDLSMSIRDLLGLSGRLPYDNLEFERGRVLPAPPFRMGR